MSRIYFHSPSGTLEIYGRERAWMGCLTDDIAHGALGLFGYGADRFARFLPPGAFPLREMDDSNGWGIRFRDSLRLWTRDGNAWVVDGQPYDCWQLNLNTVLAVGNDPLKLCARLHGQCEIHCYIEGQDRAWLAGIIADGIRLGVMRNKGYTSNNGFVMPNGKPYGQGQWSDLAHWLINRDDEPVVCSYSVCEQFPNPGVAGWEDDNDGDDWYKFPAEERWARALAGLRENRPRIGRADWAEYRFGHGKDAFWLIEQAERVADHADHAGAIP